jgi:hypothetical protein
VSVAVALYLGLYFIFFRSVDGYMTMGIHIIAKIPNQAAAFLYLAEPMVDRFSIDWRGMLALAATAGVAVACVRCLVPGAWVAIVLFVAPTLPTLAVPYMPQRYLTIPYAGFVLLVALWISLLRARVPRRRWAVDTGAAAAVITVVAAGSALTSADLDDYRRIAAAHERLLGEAAVVAPTVAEGVPVLVVRGETISPLHEVVASPVGLPKLAFIRSRDPYGLIDTAALFDWVLGDEGRGVEYVGDRGGAEADRQERVLIHRAGGFVELDRARDADPRLERFADEHPGFPVVRAFDLDR